MSPDDLRIRQAEPGDADALGEAFGPAPILDRLRRGDPGMFVLIAERAGGVVAAMPVETSGHPIDDDWAWCASMLLAADDDADEACVALCEAALEALGAASAGGRPPDALAVSVDVGDRAAARRLEAAGFRPVGGAYRVLGPGMVEHLHGYTDPSGYQVDFLRRV